MEGCGYESEVLDGDQYLLVYCWVISSSCKDEILMLIHLRLQMHKHLCEDVCIHMRIPVPYNFAYICICKYCKCISSAGRLTGPSQGVLERCPDGLPKSKRRLAVVPFGAGKRSIQFVSR